MMPVLLDAVVDHYSGPDVISILIIGIGVLFIGLALFGFVLWHKVKKKDRGDKE